MIIAEKRYSGLLFGGIQAPYLNEINYKKIISHKSNIHPIKSTNYDYRTKVF
jgi:hypothetical protein